MGNEIAKLDYDNAKMVATLKQTVAQGLTDPEFALFVEFCKGTGLNPLKKEIWAIKAGNRLQLMVGINGFWAIANSHPQFDGSELEIETDDRGKPIKAICKIYRKDRRFPSIGIALLSEYGKASPIWQSMPSVMLTKCAESVAIRKAFPQELNGLYSEEEMPVSYSAEAIATPTAGVPVKVRAALSGGVPIEVRATTSASAETAPAAIEEPADGQWKYTAKRVKPEKLEDFNRFMKLQGAVEDTGREIWTSSKRMPNCDKYLAKPDDIKATLHDTDYPDFDPPGAPLPPIKEKLTKKTKQTNEENVAHEN